MDSKDKAIMKYLVGYVMGKPFPLKHTVMDVDDVYGIRVFTPSQIFESTVEPEPEKNNTRFLITFQDLNKARVFASEAGVWRSASKFVSIFDANKRRMGTVKISWYYYYYYNTDKSAWRKRRSEWHMKEYYLTSKYLPLNKVERKNVLLTMMIKTNKEQKANNDNNQGGKSMMQINHSPQSQINDVSSQQQQIMQSLQALQLQDSSY